MTEVVHIQHNEGWISLRKQIIRAITEDRESVIEAWHNLDNSLLKLAIAQAQEQKTQYLTIEVGSQDDSICDFLLSSGFQLESSHISVDSRPYSPPADSPYQIRAPQSGDDFSIAVLNATMLEHTLCAGRSYDLAQLSLLSMQATFEQVQRDDDNILVLVLIHKRAHIGHLLLELSPDKGYIVDLAVAHQHWGGRATSYLMRSGSHQLYLRKIPLLVGDVSANNQRALQYARRFLGFKIRSQRYGLKL